MPYFSADKAPHANPDTEGNISSSQSKSFHWPFKQNETIVQKAKSILTRRKTKNIEQLHSISEKSDVFFLKKKRWQIAILANIGFVIVFGIRCNFGAAKGRMINNFTDPFGNNHVYIQINSNNNSSSSNDSENKGERKNR
ncbi:hypothetical protein LOAG_08196 [Loa loa]|uniref:Uncharacterized protein n=1 Tax=Loa loa TaxID=7209 RepID=A0A1I7VTJ5_LOALO|nr:hypothetical protein LOAG_08196 [Loa loa]EFO20289.1 hypothetical protein LOAG_08196 [Loa loa]